MSPSDAGFCYAETEDAPMHRGVGGRSTTARRRRRTGTWSDARRRIGALAAGAELVVVPGAGHAVNVTRSDVVNAAVTRLLERVRPPAVGRDRPWFPGSG